MAALHRRRRRGQLTSAPPIGNRPGSTDACVREATAPAAPDSTRHDAATPHRLSPTPTNQPGSPCSPGSPGPSATVPLQGQRPAADYTSATTTYRPIAPGRAAAGPPSGGKLVLIAPALAVIAVVLVNVYVELVRRQAQTGEFTVYRFITSQQPGSGFSEGMVEPSTMPDRYRDAFPDALTREQMLNRVGQPLVQGARQSAILTGEQFTADAGQRLDAEVAIGRRAVALRVNARNLPNIAPGMFVDIEAPFIGVGQRSGLSVLPVMERVKVLSVGRTTVIQQRRGGADRPSTFTTIDIEVSPEEATDLSMIAKVVAGDFELLIRNPADDRSFKLDQIAGDNRINPAVISHVDRVSSRIVELE